MGSVWILLVGLTTLAPAAHAKMMRTFTVGEWKAAAFSDNRTGAFSHCAASGTYRSGVTVMFSIQHNYTWLMSLLHPDWRLPEGNVYDIAFTIDDMSPLVAKATAMNRSQVRVPLDDNVELFNRFRKGRQLRVAAAGQVFSFNLDQTSRLLDELLQCTRLAGKAPSVAANPFEPAKKGERSGATDRSKQPLDPALQAEAATLAANVLSKSGAQGFAFVSAEKASELRSHAAWSAEDKSFGMLTVLPNHSDTKQLPQLVIARDAGRCKGSFLSGSIPEDGNSQLTRIFTTCQENGEKSTTVYYLAIPRKKGGLYVFSALSLGSELRRRVQPNRFAACYLT